jgi:hypothetical protein
LPIATYEIRDAGLPGTKAATAPALTNHAPVSQRMLRILSYGVSAMSQDQEHEYAYHQDKLLMLITRRARLQANSEQIPKLDAEIAAINDLLRSHRILKAME